MTGKSHFRAANVWWRCAQYFVIVFWLDTYRPIDVCIWRIFLFMSVVVTVWGMWECLLCSGRC